VAIILGAGKIAKCSLRQMGSGLKWNDLGNKPIHLVDFTFKIRTSWFKNFYGFLCNSIWWFRLDLQINFGSVGHKNALTGWKVFI